MAGLVRLQTASTANPTRDAELAGPGSTVAGPLFLRRQSSPIQKTMGGRFVLAKRLNEIGVKPIIGYLGERHETERLVVARLAQ